MPDWKRYGSYSPQVESLLPRLLLQWRAVFGRRCYPAEMRTRFVATLAITFSALAASGQERGAGENNAGAGSFLIWYFVLLFLTAGVCGLINRMKKRPLNSFKLALIVVFVVFVVRVALTVYVITVRPIVGPDLEGQLIGEQIGAAIIPLIVAFLLAKRNARSLALRPPVS